jgi:predicted DNA-binding transcriptional regulator AlpA
MYHFRLQRTDGSPSNPPHYRSTVLAWRHETVLRWIDTRGLPAIRLTSRALRYDEAAIEAWLSERATRADDVTQEVSPTRNAARPGEAYGAVPSDLSPIPLRHGVARPKQY